ncbi:hypothetical protein [Kyrpidia tusciae]|uniref:Type II toxin-antitoxin system MqsR family toxin n=1 Tax=Kyrpidia tusciae (strain DSM 2912 / NBRC 15312 / T2) TaxID=562970 RepID=D5WW12_KYRT2|nr:hypothetical protein [Kyrpidia tusciae]ADG05644.1 conserved hypothetical protein [Kyrpidia tusciae DSM 2912]
MPRIAEPREIIDFLTAVKHVAARPGGFDLIPRKETLNVLAEHGWGRSFPRTVVRSLTIRNYSHTDADRDRPGEIWVFGTRIQSVSFYIKLKLDRVDGRHMVRCLSFHPEREGMEPLRFPYQVP